MAHQCLSVESVIAAVEKRGFFVLAVHGDDDGPGFVYSIGLYHSFKHPEIIVLGLEQEVAGWVIKELALRIEAGERYDAKEECEGLCWSTGLTKKRKAIGSSTSQEILVCSQQAVFSTRIIRYSWSTTMMTETGSFYAGRPMRQISASLSA